jgi:hypothetical protein
VDCIGISFPDCNKRVGSMIHENFNIWNLIVLILFYKSVSFIPGEYSMLLVSFHLQRHMGNFLIQVYGPCVLLVVLSWVSFWLNREATADRVSLGKIIPTYSDKIPLFLVMLRYSLLYASLVWFTGIHKECFYKRIMVEQGMDGKKLNSTFEHIHVDS